MSKLDIEDGLNIKTELTHLEAPSGYNFNYYTYKGKLLYAISDDDCNTNWYIIEGNSMPIYLGYSDARDEPEILHRQESESY